MKYTTWKYKKGPNIWNTPPENVKKGPNIRNTLPENVKKGPNIWNTLPENVKKKYPLAILRNTWNRHQVRLASSKFA